MSIALKTDIPLPPRPVGLATIYNWPPHLIILSPNTSLAKTLRNKVKTLKASGNLEGAHRVKFVLLKEIRRIRHHNRKAQTKFKLFETYCRDYWEREEKNFVFAVNKLENDQIEFASNVYAGDGAKRSSEKEKTQHMPEVHKKRSIKRTCRRASKQQSLRSLP